MSSAASFRVEKDLLGTLEVPADAYYGIQTLRAANNFHLSGVPLSHYPKLVVVFTADQAGAGLADGSVLGIAQVAQLTLASAAACLTMARATTSFG